jgi:hypothetical protein
MKQIEFYAMAVKEMKALSMMNMIMIMIIIMDVKEIIK